jgi:hypothetical protein
MEDPFIFEVKEAIDLLADDSPKFDFENNNFTIGFNFKLGGSGLSSEEILSLFSIDT